jgi:hypothetical protein
MSKRILLMLMSLIAVLGIVDTASARSAPSAAPVRAAAEDDEVVLPSRIASLIARVEASMANATEHVDEAEYAKAIVSLRAVRTNLARADKEARFQITAPPAPDPDAEPADPTDPADPSDPEAEGEATTGPDSVIAVLALDQEVVEGLAGLLNGRTGTVVGAVGTTMNAVQTTRDKLLATVIGLDPEGAGADYADGMADTVDGYTDEVANLTNALAQDTLSAGGKSTLTAALAKSKATAAKVATAFGGGE